MTPAKFSSCLISDEISIPNAPSMNPHSNSAGSKRQIAERRRFDIPEPGDQQEGVDLQHRDQRARQQFRCQQPPARERADQQRAHSAGFPVIDHRQRRLHAVEKLDHRDQPGRDIDLVKNVGLVGRNDRDAENLPEAGGKNKQPDQRPHQRGDEAFALMDEAQGFAPDDALHADQILRERRSDAVSGRFVGGGHPVVSSSLPDRRRACVSLVNADAQIGAAGLADHVA